MVCCSEELYKQLHYSQQKKIGDFVVVVNYINDFIILNRKELSSVFTCGKVSIYLDDIVRSVLEVPSCNSLCCYKERCSSAPLIFMHQMSRNQCNGLF